MKRNGVPRPAERRKVIGYIRRLEAGAVTLDMAADVDIHEFAAIMEALTAVAKARGFSPGMIAKAHQEVMMAQRGITPAPPE